MTISRWYEREKSEICFSFKSKAGMTKTKKESFTVKGEKLLEKVKELIHEGNVRKITITNKDGKELVTFPLTIGVVGAVFAPVLAAIGALAALVTECTLTVEREE
jgi:CBS domain-containing protein